MRLRLRLSLIMKTFLIPSLIALSLFSAQASERRFAFSYPSLTSPLHELELENSVTIKLRPGSQRRFAFKHELEYGLTEKTQVALYLANWSTDRFEKRSYYQNSGVEIIHNITNPVSDLVGSAVLGEVVLGDEMLKLEGKLILEKRVGRWSTVWNGTVESEWEGDRFGAFQKSSGELEQTLAVGYDLTKRLSLSLEAVQAFPIPEWQRASRSEVYVGPSMSFRTKGFYATFATLFQTTNRSEAPSLQARLIFGIDL